jgi:hypothetical protein
MRHAVQLERRVQLVSPLLDLHRPSLRHPQAVPEHPY